MSTATLEASRTAERGTTRIAARVVERIAARAARDSGPVTGPGGVRALTGRSDEPQVSATVDGRIATVRVTLGVVYPASVAGTTRAVRSAVRARVEELTGISVRQVDIDVTRMPSAEDEPRRVR